ncbi:hypothetical protein D3C80_2167700 [compost metagenome]
MLTISNAFSDFVELNALLAAISSPPYMMLSFVVFFIIPLAVSNRIILTNEVNILIAVP